MKKYEVTVVQKFAKYAIIEVEANNVKEAKEIALDSDIDWQEPRDNTDFVRSVDLIE